jgi:hypothetical protein
MRAMVPSVVSGLRDSSVCVASGSPDTRASCCVFAMPFTLPWAFASVTALKG